jgi:hypothetical protein
MPNRRAITRNGEMERVVLENIRQGHSIKASCAAAGVGLSSYYRHSDRSPAFRRDVEDAMRAAEHRLVGLVLEAAATDYKAAAWVLERRWPREYGPIQRLDARIEGHHDVDIDILALARRYSSLTPEQTEEEIKKLGWATERSPAMAGRITTGEASDAPDQIVGGAEAPNGGGTAILRPALPNARRDETPEAGDNGAEPSTPPPPLVGRILGPLYVDPMPSPFPRAAPAISRSERHMWTAVRRGSAWCCSIRAMIRVDDRPAAWQFH